MEGDKITSIIGKAIKIGEDCVYEEDSEMSFEIDGENLIISINNIVVFKAYKVDVKQAINAYNI